MKEGRWLRPENGKPSVKLILEQPKDGGYRDTE
jgi:hypothetical protein